VSWRERSWLQNWLQIERKFEQVQERPGNLPANGHSVRHDGAKRSIEEDSMSYPPPLAATLSGASVRQLGYWRRATRAHGPLFAPEYGTRPRVLYSYRDIVALRMFVQLRGQLSLQRVRKAVAWLEANHPDTHLSAHRVKAVPGQQTALWISADGNYVDIVERPGQVAFKIIMDDLFSSFTTGSGRYVPNLSEPALGVTVDPEVRGGYPVIAGTRIPFNIVAGLHADGVPAEEIAMLYPSVTASDVEGATQLAELVALNTRTPTAA